MIAPTEAGLDIDALFEGGGGGGEESLNVDELFGESPLPASVGEVGGSLQPGGGLTDEDFSGFWAHPSEESPQASSPLEQFDVEHPSPAGESEGVSFPEVPDWLSGLTSSEVGPVAPTKTKTPEATELPRPAKEEVPVSAASPVSEAETPAAKEAGKGSQEDEEKLRQKAREELGDVLDRRGDEAVEAIAEAQVAVAADPNLQSAESRQALWNVAKLFGAGTAAGAVLGVGLDVIGGYLRIDRATNDSIKLILGGLSVLSAAGIHIFAESVKDKGAQFPRAARLAQEISGAYLVPIFAGVGAGLLAETGVEMAFQPDALSSMGTAAGDAASKAQEFAGGVVRNAQDAVGHAVSQVQDAVSGNSGEPGNLVESTRLQARQAAEVAKQAQHAVAQANASDVKEMAESAKTVAELAAHQAAEVARQAAEAAANQAAEVARQAAEAAAKQAAEAVAKAAGELAAQQTVEAARLAVLQQGQTVAELLPNMLKHTPHEVIYNWIGDVPHRGEIANSLVRSFQTAGVDLNSLHQGTVTEAAKALGEQFVKADGFARQMGVPYNEGGLWATRALDGGANSNVARLIESANLKNMAESAGQVWNNILRPVVGLATGH